MQNETVGWVKSIHETRYGELLGLVMVGPHVTDLIEAGVVALDAEATVETVADGMAAHPTLAEAIRRRASSPSAARSTCRTQAGGGTRLVPARRQARLLDPEPVRPAGLVQGCGG